MAHAPLRVRGGSPSAVEAERPAQASGEMEHPAPGHTGLPPYPGELLRARARGIETIRGLLAHSRLVTLTGPGGVGKTRARLREPAGAQRTGSACGCVCRPGVAGRGAVAGADRRRGARGARRTARPDHSIGQTLGFRRVVLLLDNCEHLLEACARLVTALLTVCSGLRLLATSRERLALAGEAVFDVAPLSLPDADAGAEALNAAESSTLLLARTQSRQ